MLAKIKVIWQVFLTTQLKILVLKIYIYNLGKAAGKHRTKSPNRATNATSSISSLSYSNVRIWWISFTCVSWKTSRSWFCSSRRIKYMPASRDRIPWIICLQMDITCTMRIACKPHRWVQVTWMAWMASTRCLTLHQPIVYSDQTQCSRLSTTKDVRVEFS